MRNLFLAIIFMAQPVFAVADPGGWTDPSGCPVFDACVGGPIDGYQVNTAGIENFMAMQQFTPGATEAPFLTAHQLMQDLPTIDIQLPGLWAYSSLVPGGRGFHVGGIDYNVLNTNASPPKFQQGSTFNTITDTKGNRYGYAGFFKINQGLSPRLYRIGYAGGAIQKLYYDDRGNVTKREFLDENETQTLVIKTGYVTNCSHTAWCNKPIWTDDAEGNRTNSVYSDVHGHLLKETGPLVKGVRPQTRYTYQALEARYRDATGQIVGSGVPIWKLTEESYCIKGNPNAAENGCALGAADEVVTIYDYGPSTGANNLLLRGKSVTASGQTLRTCYTYDDLGNLVSETTPNANLTSCS